MADQARGSIEDFVQHLVLIRDKGLSDNEIEIVTEKISKYEYNLRNMRKLESDFRQYVDYCVTLRKLITKRRKKMAFENTATRTKDEGLKKFEIFIGRKISLIYRLGNNVFHNIEWMQDFIRHSKKGANAVSVRLCFESAIGKYSQHAPFWLDYAQWARKTGKREEAKDILLRGIRAAPKQRDLWLAYIHHELFFSARLTEGVRADQLARGKTEEQLRLLFNGGIAFIVYQNAIKALPEDPTLRLEALKLFKEFSDPEVNVEKRKKEKFRLLDMQYAIDALLKEARTKFSTNVAFLNQLPKDDLNVDEEHRLYREQLNAAKPEEKPRLYVSYVSQLVSMGADEGVINEILEEAVAAKCYDEALLKCYVQHGDQKAAEKATSLMPRSNALWRMRLHRAILGHQGDKKSEALELFMKATKANPTSDDLYIAMLEYCIYNSLPTEEVYKLKPVKQNASNALSSTSPIHHRYLLYVASLGDITLFRNTYKSLFRVAGKTKECFEACIQVEKILPTPDTKSIRDLYSNFSKSHSKDEDVWFDYWCFESSLPPHLSQFSAVYTNAKRNLDNPTKFIERCARRQNTK
ncbi:UTP6, small subunit (SSU) processome component [Planoprotostelium fungivorum]|uniref:UTP6, small subunit (SSU) processome component n=1 Tax=Planoprotostelium fungivorum TaxID=1890364 RepID=A0A2P6MNU8_9EUKA|nr:UTP6, small subunit (SSU) processome component [Planoprotostelium fungivorum]